MNGIFYFIIGIAVLVQLTAAHRMEELGIPCNIVLAVIVLSGFFYGNYRAVAYGAGAAGLVLDAYSGAPFGAITAGLLTVAVVSAALSRGLPREHFVHFLLYAVAGAMSFYGMALIVMKVANFSFSVPWADAAQIVAYAVAEMTLIYIIYRWSILLKDRRSGR